MKREMRWAIMMVGAAGLLWGQAGEGAKPAAAEPLHAKQARPAPEWLTRGVMYQVYLRAFTPEGTLQAAAARLPKLAELGADILYLCPMFVSDDDMDQAFWSPRQKASKMNNPRNPYRMKDFYHVDSEYGTDADLKAFVAKAHALKQRVLLDMVFLHCGPKAVFIEQHPDFVQRDKDGKIVLKAWNFPGLNFASPALREYLWANMEHWVREFDVDGFRCDVADGVPLDFWEAARERLEKIRPDIAMLAEGSKPANQVKAFDICYGFDWFGGVNSVMEGKSPVSKLPALWEKMAAARPRGARFIRYFDNHDISNDDWENRREKKWSAAGCQAVLALCFTLDGVPFLYNGQEVADAARHSIYARLPVQWANGETPAGQARFAFCQKLCALRRAERALTQGEVLWLKNGQPDQVLSFARKAGDETVVTVINLAKTPASTWVDLPEGVTALRPLLADGVKTGAPDAGRPVFACEAFGFFVGKK